MTSAALQADPTTVLGFVRATRTEHDRTLAQLSRLLGLADASKSDEEAVRNLLSSDRATPDKQLIAAALLHLLSVSPASFEEMPTRAWAFEFLFRELGDLKRFVGLTNKMQTFEQEEVLREMVPRARADVEAALEQLHSLDTLPAAKQAFQRAVGHPPNEFVLKPFAPGFPRTRVSEVFDMVSGICDADPPTFVAAHGRALETIDALSAQATAQGGLAEETYGSMAQRLRSLADKAFFDSDVARPGELAVKAGEKKYPLHRAGEDLEVQLRVENTGLGQALNVRLEIGASAGLDVRVPSVPLGTLQSGAVGAIVDATVSEAGDAALLEGKVTWRNSDDSPGSSSFELTVEAQRPDVPWDELALEAPYDLEPVTEARELVGRREVLSELSAAARGKRMGNTYVTGQKRVGKTSIVKTLASTLEDEPDLQVVYLEGGDYVDPEPSATIAALGEALCEAIAASDPRLNDLTVPTFDRSLTPFGKFLGEARTRIPKLRLLLLLDEFDELPVTLYRPGDVGNALFLTLRAIGGRPYVGIVLVGGEKMEPVVAAQGEALNKFNPQRIDYFDRERHWDDFRELVRAPVRDWGLEVSEEAIVALHGLSAGHPYFTKLVCGTLFKQAVARRDAHLTLSEVERAEASALAQVAPNAFQHFWRDGILESGEKVEEISIRRAQVLLALGEALLHGRPTKQAICEAAAAFALDEQTVLGELRMFVQRGVLVDEGTVMRCKVRLFERWLREYGLRQIRTAFSDIEAVAAFKRREQELQVKPEEITEVLARWGAYRHVHKSVDDVRQWLSQFGDLEAQRAVFPILQGLTFYDGRLLRAKMREAHEVVRRDIRHRVEPRRKRADILVTYLDGPAKSGARCAHLYADENNILAANVVEPSKVQQALTERRDVQALAVFDDFIGTGESAATGLRELAAKAGGLLRRDDFKIVLVAVTGFVEGKAQVEEAGEDLELPLVVHLCDPLDERDRVFSATSRFFPDEASRQAAHALVHATGQRLVKRDPLGHRGGQAAVVFDEGCPNNSLPVLWALARGWTPLFPRWTTRN
jgi:hypothetical protein